MSKQKKLLWEIGIITIYVVIAVVGFAIAYVIKTTFFKPSPLSPTTSTANQVTVIPTPSGWKTYENTTYQLHFSYPSTDTVKTSSYGFGVANLTLQSARGGTDFQLLLLPKSLAQMVGQDFDSYYAMPNNTSKVIKSPLPNNNATEKFTKIGNKTVDGLRAVNYTSLPSTAKPGTQPEIGTFIETGDNLVLISTGEENKSKLQQLLSTFLYQ